MHRLLNKSLQGAPGSPDPLLDTEGSKIHIQDGTSGGAYSIKFNGGPSLQSSSRYLKEYAGQGVLHFGTMSSRKPITHGFYNPHEERFNLPKNQFPEILTKHRQ
jgi:hypothetical protein